MKKLIVFFATWVVFLLIDFLWIGYVSKGIYFDAVGLFLRKPQDMLLSHWICAMGVYVLFALGIVLFVLPKAQNSYFLACVFGALFGLIVYGIYDLTNYSVLSIWPLKITLIDIAWGTTLCSLTSCIALFVQKR